MTPELRNSDDEAMRLCEVRFPLTVDEARAAEVLDRIEGFEREAGGESRTKAQMGALSLHRNEFRGDWNYELRPR